MLYNNNSPYRNSILENNQYLGVLSIRPVPSEADDILYTIDSQYTHRPDLLSFDIYDTPALWWVFAQRNMDIIKDPIYDFVAGTTIYLPKGQNVKKYLGG